MPTPKQIKPKVDKPVDNETRQEAMKNLRKVQEAKKYPVPGKHDRQSHRKK